jgi:hypothetical protein
MAKKAEVETVNGVIRITIHERRRFKDESDEDYAANSRKITVAKDFGTDLKASAKLFGEDVVHALFLAKGVIQIQDGVRPMMKDNKTDSEITAYVDGISITLPQRGRKKSDYDKAKDSWSKLPQEEKDALLQELMG